MSERIYNFASGPAVLPEPVLRRAQESIWNFRGTGIGVLEHSHRGAAFEAELARAEALLRRVAGIPDDYAVLFLQGGASQQFAAKRRSRPDPYESRSCGEPSPIWFPSSESDLVLTRRLGVRSRWV